MKTGLGIGGWVWDRMLVDCTLTIVRLGRTGMMFIPGKTTDERIGFV